MYEVPPGFYMHADTSVSPLIAAQASPILVEKATAVIPAPELDVNADAEVEMGVDDIVLAPTFKADVLLHPAVINEQHE